MTPDEIIKAIEFYDRKFPRKALEAAIADPDAIIPELLKVLEYVNNNIQEVLDTPDYMAHMYALFLLAQFREKRAYPLIIEFISKRASIVETLLEDMITEDLDRILASVFDGQLEPLYSVIESPKVNEWVKNAALRTLTILVTQDVLSRDEVMDYFATLYRGKIKHTPKNVIVLGSLVMESTHLYPEEVYEDIKVLFDKDLVDEIYIDLQDVDNTMERGKEVTLQALKTYPYQRRTYIEDTIAEMENWAAFRPKETMRKLRSLTKKVAEGQVVRHGHKVGRNEPCPCGSGLKYKRCCGKNQGKQAR